MQERAIERGEWLSPEEVEARRPKVRTLQETYDRFLAQRPRPLALSTLTAYEQDWRLRIVHQWGAERDVKTITHDDVWQWRQGLRRMDLDLEGRRILVRQAIEHGKDGDAYRVGVKVPKTSAGIRSLPMSTTLVTILRDHLTLHPRSPEQLVFTVADGKPMGPAEADRRHNRALANMGLRTPEAERRRLWRKGLPIPKEDHITLHDLRASYAAWLFSEGYTITEVMLL